MNGFNFVVSIVKVPVSPKGCSTLGAAPLKGIFDTPGQSISRVTLYTTESQSIKFAPGRPVSRILSG